VMNCCNASKFLSYIFKNCECREKSHDVAVAILFDYTAYNVCCYEGISFHFLMVVSFVCVCCNTKTKEL